MMKMALFFPELFLLLSCLVIFLLTLGKMRSSTVRNITAALSIIAFLICAGSLRLEGDLFFKAYRIDLFSQLFKLAITGGVALLLLFSRELKGIEETIRAEYYLFLLLSALGLVMLVSSVELLSIFVALELSSYALYLLVPMRDDHSGLREQMEAGIKYILFGVVATGIMLFGMSYLFGLTGTTYLSELIPAMNQVIGTPAAIVGIALVMGGFFFKLGLFPFHFWLPDVYQGASNETTAFIASVPKLGAVALLIRVATLAAPSAATLVNLLMILAVCSMFYGNLIALVQKDIKRMLAFSGIAHAGFVILGIITLKDTGFAGPASGLYPGSRHVCPGGHSALCRFYGQVHAAGRCFEGRVPDPGHPCRNQYRNRNLLLPVSGARQLLHRPGREAGFNSSASYPGNQYCTRAHYHHNGCHACTCG
jgi:NADH-quinone oxidoreductase subunit N